MATAVQFPIWATGRRKTSVARVRVVPGSGRLLINDKPMNEYFRGHVRALADVSAPLHHSKTLANGYDIFVSVAGGGTTGQSGAVKLGLARAFVQIDPGSRTVLKKEGLLSRDPRMVERKKPGRPKARRRFQHSKR